MKLTTQPLFVLLLLLFTAPLFAQDPEVVASEEEEEEPSFQFSGYVDAYYQANLSNSGSAEEAPLVFGSSFTDYANTFGIGNVNLLAEKSFGKVSFVGQIGFGPRAVAANSDSNLGVAGTNFASTVQQLYVTYSPSDALTFTLGNFGTFVGYEVIDAPANMNYSMSYLFSNGPFYHTGAKVDIAIADGFGAMVGIFNDTDSKLDVVSGKHLGGQLSAEAGGLSAYLNVLYGKDAEGEMVNDTEDDLYEFQVDLTATFEASESLMFGLNASNYATSVDGTDAGGFFGTALYTTVGVGEGFDLSLRGEYFANTAVDGDDTDQPSVLALTASGNIEVGPLRIIPEIRFDTGSNGFTFGEEADDDSALAIFLAGVYSF
ncbi:outer membrane beta-barrel protein [Lewinella sp. JB7]|uniref:outer membrane beta-barrel protein n=1 Tax=Lewinella sp. JB7 TaxID=2962887 RepID=UPI0020CA099B|nr:outer membrane beta-barrel protein [Lewinella sp. JB7]MCP9235936.1 porin [Lewinella sp. JB7]